MILIQRQWHRGLHSSGLHVGGPGTLWRRLHLGVEDPEGERGQPLKLRPINVRSALVALARAFSLGSMPAVRHYFS